MSTVATWPTQAEAWLDDKGKGAWIAAMVLGMIFFWPVGLAILFYMIWSKRMFKGSCGNGRARHNAWHHRQGHPHQHGYGHRSQGTGNSAFDAYRDETLRRLEQEQEDFEAFLQRLRDAKDKSEFDDFMDARAKQAREERDTKLDDGDGPLPA